MYEVLLGVQILMTAAILISILLLSNQHNSNSSKYLLITSICVFVQNAGYITEMLSDNIFEAMISLRLEYLGGAFVATAMMVFVFSYCRVHLLRWIRFAVLAVDLAVLVSVWAYKYTGIYYSTTNFVDKGFFRHMEFGKGPLYILFAILLFVQLLASVVVSLVSTLREQDAAMRKNYIMLTVSCAAPVFFYVFGAVDMFRGFDCAPIGGAVGIVIFSVAIAKNHAFDVIGNARENIIMELNEAIIILDYNKGYQEANDKAKKLFPEIFGTRFGDMIPNEELTRRLMNDTDEDLEIEGKFYKFRISEVINDSDSKVIGYFVMILDVTAARLQIAKIEELRHQADVANMAKSTFLANVSHEIRTPVTTVIGTSDLILRDYSDPTIVSYANDIQMASKTLLDLIDDILDFSKIESGRTTITASNYHMDRFFRELLVSFSTKGSDKGIYFKNQISPSIPVILRGDEMRLRQIVTNLLTNAFKYTFSGGVTFRAAFEWLTEQKGNLILSVEDTGVGIKKENINQIFESFVRIGEKPVGDDDEGNGLGLKITKKLVEMMGGEIKVYSEYGKGSVFTVIIPQEVSCAKNEVIGELQENGPVKHMRKRIGFETPNAKILIVDDSRTNLIVAKALLRDTKATVTTCSSGEECLECVKHDHYDLVFLDHRMPEMDGIQTLHKMNMTENKCKNVPIIMLTANAVSGAKDFYTNEGFADFLSKPINEDSICTMVRKHLNPELIVEKED